VLRGSVLSLRRRIGFNPSPIIEHFVVLQADWTADTIETVLVAPLDVADRLYDGDPLVVEVSARESGTKRSQVILLAHILSVRKDRFQAEPVGALKPETLTRVANGLERIFDL
jgi:mRNA-degrading endonuclease toxin of MazEF toxin-antitoxin module